MGWGELEIIGTDPNFLETNRTSLLPTLLSIQLLKGNPNYETVGGEAEEGRAGLPGVWWGAPGAFPHALEFPRWKPCIQMAPACPAPIHAAVLKG